MSDLYKVNELVYSLIGFDLDELIRFEVLIPAKGIVSLDDIDRARIPCEHNRYERHRTCGCIGILHSHHNNDPVEWFWCDPWTGVEEGDE